MAKKVFVTFPNLKAEVSNQFLEIKAGVAYQLAKGEISWTEVQATEFTILSFADLKADVAYQFARGEISWAELQLSNASLNYYSINQYFGPEIFSLEDNTLLALSKTESETLSLSEAQEINLQKQISEALAVTDIVSIVVVFNRSFSDSSDISDLAVLTLEKVAADSVSLSDYLNAKVARENHSALNTTPWNTFPPNQ